MASDKEYFAAQEPDDLAQELISRVDKYAGMVERSYYFEWLREAYWAYYGLDKNGARTGGLRRGGYQGEMFIMNVNHFRNILNHIMVLVTANRPALRTRAANNDAKSMEQAVVGDAILEHYMIEKRLEDHINRVVELAIVLGEGFIRLDWDVKGGDLFGVDPDTGEQIFTGDLKYSTLSPFDVIRDPAATTAQEDWLITRTWVNKYDLAARFPEKKDAILELPSKAEAIATQSYYSFEFTVEQDTDLVALYEFFHKRSDALPDGRIQLFTQDGEQLYTGPLPYRNIPVYRMTAGEILGMPYGYSVSFDLLPIQEALTRLYSAALSNQLSFASQSVVTTHKSGISVESLVGGLNLLKVNSKDDKPEALQLTSTPAETFQYQGTLVGLMETISGINAVSRGNAKERQSGSVVALLQSMALQFNSHIEKEYARLLERVGTAHIEILQDMATVPRLVPIVGKDKQWMLKSYSSDDISRITRVYIEPTNPLSKTVAGKLELAGLMAGSGHTQSLDDLQNIIDTGRAPSQSAQTNEDMAIAEASERLRAGEPVEVLPTDDHLARVKAYRALLHAGEPRTNPQIRELIESTIVEHLTMYQELSAMNPLLLLATGQQPLPQPPPPTDAQAAEAVEGMAEEVSPEPSGDQRDVSLPEAPATQERQV